MKQTLTDDAGLDEHVIVLTAVQKRTFLATKIANFHGCKRETAALATMTKCIAVHRAADWVKPRSQILCTCCGAVMKIVRTRIAASIVGESVAPFAAGGAC